MKKIKREIDLTTEEKRKEFFGILNGFKSKTEAYEYLGISGNNNGIKYLKELANKVGFDLNIYAERRAVKLKKCLECGKEFKPEYLKQKFCSRSCCASYNNRLRPPYNESFRKKISESLYKYYKNKPHKNNDYRTLLNKRVRITPKVCPICGKTDCERKGVCYHTKKFFENLTYFGFDMNCLGTEKVFDEYDRVKKVLEEEYFNNHLSPSDLKEKYQYPKTFENITHVLKRMGLNTRNHLSCQTNAMLIGKQSLPTSSHDIKMGFKQGWHTTWEGKKIFYRSGAELKYAELLDEEKVSYDVESLRIEYYDTEKAHNRVAIPDFILTNTNEIVEVKSRITFRKQNMLDKFKRYKELGYKPKMLYEGVMYNDKEINNIEQFDFLITK